MTFPVSFAEQFSKKGKKRQERRKNQIIERKRK